MFSSRLLSTTTRPSWRPTSGTCPGWRTSIPSSGPLGSTATGTASPEHFSRRYGYGQTPSYAGRPGSRRRKLWHSIGTPMSSSHLISMRRTRPGGPCSAAMTLDTTSPGAWATGCSPRMAWCTGWLNTTAGTALLTRATNGRRRSSLRPAGTLRGRSSATGSLPPPWPTPPSGTRAMASPWPRLRPGTAFTSPRATTPASWAGSSAITGCSSTSGVGAGCMCSAPVRTGSAPCR